MFKNLKKVDKPAAVQYAIVRETTVFRFACFVSVDWQFARWQHMEEENLIWAKGWSTAAELMGNFFSSRPNCDVGR